MEASRRGRQLRNGRVARAISFCISSMSVTQPEGLCDGSRRHENFPPLNSVFPSSETFFFILNCSNFIYPCLNVSPCGHPHKERSSWSKQFLFLWEFYGWHSTDAWSLTDNFSGCHYTDLHWSVPSLLGMAVWSSAWNPSPSLLLALLPACVCVLFIFRKVFFFWWGGVIDCLRLIVVFIIYCHPYINWKFGKMLSCLNG